MCENEDAEKQLNDLLDKDNKKLNTLESDAEKLLVYDLPIKEQKKYINKVRKYFNDRKDWDEYKYIFDDKTFWNGYISDLDFLNKIKLKDFRNALLYVIKDIIISYKYNKIIIDENICIMSNIGRLDLALNGFKKRRPCTYSMQR